MVSSEAFQQANQRGADLKAGPIATAAKYDRRIGRLVISLSTGIDVSFAPHAAQGLETAKPSEMDVIEITPSGLGLHFPKLDADLYLPALLQGFLGAERWAASRFGTLGGSAKSPAKAASARENGKRGGRPRKVVERG
jgi:hypothetical protein